MKKILFITMTFICSIIVFALVAEIILRVTKFPSPDFTYPDIYVGSKYYPNAYYLHQK